MNTYEAIRDQTLDDDCYRWMRLHPLTVRSLLTDWNANLTPQHFDSTIRNAMRDFPVPEPLK